MKAILTLPINRSSYLTKAGKWVLHLMNWIGKLFRHLAFHHGLEILFSTAFAVGIYFILRVFFKTETDAASNGAAGYLTYKVVRKIAIKIIF